LFGIEYIHYSLGYKWLATRPGVHSDSARTSQTLDNSMMPNLTDDERKLSKISIVELKNWQLNKKEQL